MSFEELRPSRPPYMAGASLRCARCEKSSDRIEALEEEVAWLRSELRLTQEADRLGAIRKGLGLFPQEALLVHLLHEAKLFVRFEVLHEQLSAEGERRRGGREVDDVTLLRVLMNRVRSKLGNDCIGTLRGIGHCLTAKGREKVDAVFR